MKARRAAEEAARKAILALPVDLTEAESPEEAKEEAFDFIVTGGVRLEKPAKETVPPRAEQNAPAPALRRERNKLVTLIRG